ncbi:hypothetical protein HKX48_007744 [Thoreauomyces humboldtii]|nr:hypothetical protein HKX48_007744 [Thoreauomyces humboldtii]
MHFSKIFLSAVAVFAAPALCAPSPLVARGSVDNAIATFKAKVEADIAADIPQIELDLVTFVQDHMHFDGILGFLVDDVVEPVLRAHIPVVDALISKITLETAHDLGEAAEHAFRNQLHSALPLFFKADDETPANAVSARSPNFLSDGLSKLVCPSIRKFVTAVRADFSKLSLVIVQDVAKNLYEELPQTLRSILHVLVGAPEKRGLTDKVEELLRQIRASVHDEIASLINALEVKSVAYVEAEVWARVSEHIVCEH